jgi:hypothetical protein
VSLLFDILEKMSLKRKRVYGEAWLDAEVEVYWETTKKWEKGKIVAWNPLRDAYKVCEVTSVFFASTALYASLLSFHISLCITFILSLG